MLDSFSPEESKKQMCEHFSYCVQKYSRQYKVKKKKKALYCIGQTKGIVYFTVHMQKSN